MLIPVAAVKEKLTAITISRNGIKHQCFVMLPYTNNDKAICCKQWLDDLAYRKLNCKNGQSYTCG